MTTERLEPDRDQYDVFLSYYWRDHSAVEQVARALCDHGLHVFLDRWYLTPGLAWPQVLERSLEQCHAVAVFVGPEPLGSWQVRESFMALDRQSRDETFPVIPVLLPGADPPLGFLKLNTWVDLHSGVADAVALEALVAAVRGLQVFREEDAPSSVAARHLPPSSSKRSQENRSSRSSAPQVVASPRWCALA
jgi:TIR domain